MIQLVPALLKFTICVILSGALAKSKNLEKVVMYYVYFLSNKTNKVLYVGITSNLWRRVYEHKQKLVKGFTERYNVNKLVYFEETSDVKTAIQREKQIKGWTRKKKNLLVESDNPDWLDLSEEWNKRDSSPNGSE